MGEFLDTCHFEQLGYKVEEWKPEIIQPAKLLTNQVRLTRFTN